MAMPLQTFNNTYAPIAVPVNYALITVYVLLIATMS